MGTNTKTISEPTTKGKSRGIYYEVGGADDAAAVVFTHGFALDHETWRRQIDTVSNTHRTLAWDVPGCGGSAETSDPGRFDVASQTLLTVLEDEGIDQAVFVGQSMGSLLNQYTAYHHPDRVRALVHVGGIPLQQGFSERTIDLMGLHVRLLQLMPGKMIYNMFGRLVARTPAAQRYVREASSRTGKENLVALERELLKDLKERIPGDLSNHPHLIVVGEHEYDQLRKKATEWHEQLPKSVYETVPDAAHLANHDNPTAFNDMLSSFLESLEQSSMPRGDRI